MTLGLLAQLMLSSTLGADVLRALLNYEFWKVEIQTKTQTEQSNDVAIILINCLSDLMLLVNHYFIYYLFSTRSKFVKGYEGHKCLWVY